MTNKLIALFVAILMQCASAPVLGQTNGMEAYRRVAEPLKASQISRVSIIHVPAYVETRSRIDQKQLKALRLMEVSFSKASEVGILDPLLAALDELKAGKASSVHEVRWGILLFDATGQERAALFLDSSGKFLQIDETRLSVQGKTLVWIKKTISDILKR